MRVIRVLLDPAVGSFARAVLRLVVLLSVVFGLSVSEEQLAGIMIAVEAALQAFAQIPFDRLKSEADSPSEN